MTQANQCDLTVVHDDVRRPDIIVKNTRRRQCSQGRQDLQDEDHRLLPRICRPLFQGFGQPRPFTHLPHYIPVIDGAKIDDSRLEQSRQGDPLPHYVAYSIGEFRRSAPVYDDLHKELFTFGIHHPVAFSIVQSVCLTVFLYLKPIDFLTYSQYPVHKRFILSSHLMSYGYAEFFHQKHIKRQKSHLGAVTHKTY